MNVKLLRRIQKHILAEPRRLNMNVVLCRPATLYIPKAEYPPCGTVGCIGGWAEALTNPKFNYHRFAIDDFLTARELLALTPEQGKRLFTEPHLAVGYEPEPEAWPIRFAKRYLNAKTPKGRAGATSARISHFIKTKGAE